MTKQLFISILLATALLSCGQKNSADTDNNKTTKTTPAATRDEISISDLKPVSEDYKFPLVHFEKNKVAGEKVNIFLQLEGLEHLPGVFKKNPFENIMPEEGNYTGSASFYAWKRNSTIHNVLSLSQEAEFVGAYPESYTVYYNFDARNGNKISLKDLFTKDGLAIVAKGLNQQVAKMIGDHMAELNKNGTSQDFSQEEKDEQITMYQRCLDGALDFSAEYYSFYFSNDSIVFERGRCSNHAMRALDELGNFVIPMAFTEIKKHLTPYGENLISGSNEIVTTLSPQGKLYKGFIDGKYPVTAIISSISNDGSLVMYYWYDKSKTPIEWSGNYKNQHFSMTEEGTAQIEADWKDNKIIGAWTGIKNKKALKLELEAY